MNMESSVVMDMPMGDQLHEHKFDVNLSPSAPPPSSSDDFDLADLLAALSLCEKPKASEPSTHSTAALQDIELGLLSCASRDNAPRIQALAVKATGKLFAQPRKYGDKIDILLMMGMGGVLIRLAVGDKSDVALRIEAIRALETLQKNSSGHWSSIKSRFDIKQCIQMLQFSMTHCERTVLFSLYTLRERLAMLNLVTSLDVNLLQAVVLTLVQLLKLSAPHIQECAINVLSDLLKIEGRQEQLHRMYYDAGIVPLATQLLHSDSGLIVFAALLLVSQLACGSTNIKAHLIGLGAFERSIVLLAGEQPASARQLKLCTQVCQFHLNLLSEDAITQAFGFPQILFEIYGQLLQAHCRDSELILAILQVLLRCVKFWNAHGGGDNVWKLVELNFVNHLSVVLRENREHAHLALHALEIMGSILGADSIRGDLQRNHAMLAKLAQHSAIEHVDALHCHADHRVSGLAKNVSSLLRT